MSHRLPDLRPNDHAHSAPENEADLEAPVYEQANDSEGQGLNIRQQVPAVPNNNEGQRPETSTSQPRPGRYLIYPIDPWTPADRRYARQLYELAVNGTPMVHTLRSPFEAEAARLWGPRRVEIQSNGIAYDEADLNVSDEEMGGYQIGYQITCTIQPTRRPDAYTRAPTYEHGFGYHDWWSDDNGFVDDSSEEAQWIPIRLNIQRFAVIFGLPASDQEDFFNELRYSVESAFDEHRRELQWRQALARDHGLPGAWVTTPDLPDTDGARYTPDIIYTYILGEEDNMSDFADDEADTEEEVSEEED